MAAVYRLAGRPMPRSRLPTRRMPRRPGCSGCARLRLGLRPRWACSSGLWEFAWWRGWADPLLLPPPHLFLANLAEQFRFFDPNGERAGALSSGGSLGVRCSA